MSAKFQVEKRDGKFTDQSRAILKEQFEELPDGWHEIQIIAARRGYSASRYKYYFDVVMTEILDKAAKRYVRVRPSTGEQWHPRNTTEVHAIMKDIYLPVTTSILIEQVGPIRGATVITAGSSTDLSDSEFINGFMEQIISDHSGPPFLIDFEDYGTWKARMKEKHDALKAKREFLQQC